MFPYKNATARPAGSQTPSLPFLSPTYFKTVGTYF